LNTSHPHQASKGTEGLRRQLSALQRAERRWAAQLRHHIDEKKRLEKENRSLKRKNELLNLDLINERNRNKNLRHTLERKDQQIAELKEQLRIAKLPSNSSNTSRPPSTDLYKPLRTSLRVKSGRPCGGQPGHPGSFLPFNPATPDQVIAHSAAYCEACGRDLTDIAGYQQEIRQVVDIPVPRPTLVNHIIYNKVCSCGHCNKGVFPAQVKSRVSYGSGVEALSVNLSACQYVPLGRIAAMLNDLFAIPISEGTVAGMLDRFEHKAAGAYVHIRQNVGEASVVGSDETSIKVNGKKGWFHTYQNPQWTFIGYHDCRGTAAQEHFYPKGFPKATLVTDCLAMQLSTPAHNHQVCIAHLLRELNQMQQMYPRHPWPSQVKALLLLALELKKQEGTLKQIKTLERNFGKLLDHSQDKAPKKIRAFWKRMIKHSAKVFSFLYLDFVPADNNGSERAIRNVKVKQKVSGQFKTHRGARQYAMNRSIIDTLNKQGRNVHDSLMEIARFSSG